ncbi:ABC transporter ATP-binding protein [Jidongwangia harbinensis]|uniref:ABC transporter ATP-binding protein n=1 Tax=Jidongwangia harbinensis TaxID=2878561 RepID=UPI001CD996B9|nr:dipeptide/oligopeptide/nickel ABC transporter ATP-binding protein [Jidongwangia harbinensis]MCA2212044.1 dipeptide/oligopeptide/nickel ABC transporter ATP-binding protein [Jidongwangia harbinensis]
MTGILLAATGLTRRYPQPRPGPLARRPVRTVLDDVDLTVSAGDRVGVVGASGAGKSTLLRLLLAVEAPDAGELRFRGRPVHPGPAGRLRWFRRQVQYVPQDPYGSLSPRLTVADIIREPLTCLAVPGDHDSRVDEVLTAVRLDTALRTRRPGELSGGQRQRVAIARALAPAPAVLVADEPVSALDPPVRVAVLDLLRDLSTATGAALVLVAHDLPAVRRACARAMVLHDGRVAEAGGVRQIFDEPRTAATRALLAAVPRLPVAAAR